MSVLLIFPMLLHLLLVVCFSSIMVVSASVVGLSVVEGSVNINGTDSIGFIDEDFICATLDWWPPEKCDYGSCSWGNASLLNLDLNNKILFNAIKAFSPLKVRLGGTLQDKVMYQRSGDQEPCDNFTKNTSAIFGITNGCLTMSRWDQLNIFFKNSGAKVVFGLNALTGREIDSNGTALGSWNSSNAEALIRYTASNGYVIYGWELGNELSGKGIGTSVTARQYAADTISLQNLVQNIYEGFQEKPIVIGPGGFFEANWFNTYVTEVSISLQVITQHIYNLGPGVDDHLVEKILDPLYLDGGSQTFRDLQNILKKSGTSTVAWVGEAGGAYNSGHNLVSNAFRFSNNYPPPCSALLWHRLMGRHVLSTNFSGTNKIRSYAHCSKISAGITLLLINLDGNKTTNVGISFINATKIITRTKKEPNQTKRTKFSKMIRNPKINEAIREEYHLTAKAGDLHSQIVLLNGKELAVNSSGIIPSLKPIKRNFSIPINVAPYSIVFVHIPSVRLPACISSNRI
ncbi:hypothetical protein LXL04_032384 [Taraxacum kok-saghyz]